MMRVLLAVLVVAMFGLAGCQKKEPTAAERLDQVKQDAEKTADKAADTAKDAADAAKDTAADAQKAAQDAAK
ncbi:MAG: hypothetical protein LLF76_14400 [Planctomycetaceae bacterium]|nr:hypothetical protein [Planctomycetaceae bacterium]